MSTLKLGIYCGAAPAGRDNTGSRCKWRLLRGAHNSAQVGRTSAAVPFLCFLSGRLPTVPKVSLNGARHSSRSLTTRAAREGTPVMAGGTDEDTCYQVSHRTIWLYPLVVVASKLTIFLKESDMVKQTLDACSAERPFGGFGSSSQAARPQ